MFVMPPDGIIAPARAALEILIKGNSNFKTMNQGV
jgi:hypothetical protein